MKILFIHLCSPYNDGWTYRENLLPTYFKEMGYEVTILTTKTISNLFDGRLEYNRKLKDSIDSEIKVIRLDYHYKFLPFLINNRLRKYKNFYKILSEISPELIYVNGLQFYDLISVSNYKKRMLKHQKPIVFGELNATHQNSANNLISKYFLHKIYYNMLICSNNYSIDKCYFGSRAAYDFSKEHYKMKDYELDLSPLGVDENKISISLSGVSRKKIRSELSIGDDKIVICTGGRLDSRKKVVELIKGFNKLDHNAILLIFGEVLSDIKEEFENLLQQSINVRYLGWLNDEKIYEVFYLSDLAIFPGSKSSLWEVATSISLPVFAQFWPGIDYIDFNGNIEFINVNSENDVYLILKKIVDDTSKLKRMRKVAKLNSMKNLSYKSIAMKIINDYKHLRLNL